MSKKSCNDFRRSITANLVFKACASCWAFAKNFLIWRILTFSIASLMQLLLSEIWTFFSKYFLFLHWPELTLPGLCIRWFHNIFARHSISVTCTKNTSLQLSHTVALMQDIWWMLDLLDNLINVTDGSFGLNIFFKQCMFWRKPGLAFPGICIHCLYNIFCTSHCTCYLYKKKTFRFNPFTMYLLSRKSTVCVSAVLFIFADFIKCICEYNKT